MKVCIVDSRVNDSSMFIVSLQDGVMPILLDYENDTFESILAKIGSAESIAYVAHGTFEPTYSFFRDVSFDMLVKESWNPFFDFLRGIKGLQYFDFLGCSLASDDTWKQVFLWMEETGINVRASLDDTGNVVSGGNWILEDGVIDAKQLYFTDAIQAYIGLLVSATITTTNSTSYTLVDGDILTFGDGTTSSITYTGTITASAGASIIIEPNTTLTINKALTFILAPIEIKSGSTLIFNGNVTSYNSVISGAGSFTKQGSRDLLLNGNNTYTGITTISSGTLTIAGSIVSNVVNNLGLRFSNTSTLTYAGSISGTGYFDKLNTGLLILTGLIDL